MALGFLPIVHGVAALFALIELIMTAYRTLHPLTTLLAGTAPY